MNPQQPKIYADYPSLVQENFLAVLERQSDEYPQFLRSLSSKADYAYAPGKWTIKEVAGHIIDTERVLIYRLTAIARGDQGPLPGFDEDSYVAAANFAGRTLESFAEEFTLMRKANLYLFKSLTNDDLEKTGIASGKEISVERLALTIAGHLIHHLNIINERYL